MKPEVNANGLAGAQASLARCARNFTLTPICGLRSSSNLGVKLTSPHVLGGIARTTWSALQVLWLASVTFAPASS